MADPTLQRTFRSNVTPGVYQALTYADMVGGAPTVSPGDYVKVLSTGITYLCTAPEEFQPVSDVRQGRRSYWTNFADLVGEPLAETDAAVYLVGSGLRVHGQGIEVNDSGMSVAYGLDGAIATCTTTDEDGHTIALSFGGNTEMWTPAANGPYEVEALVTNSSAITLRAMFIGFAGAFADALDPVVTGSTVTLTLVQDDLQGLFFDASLTASSRWFNTHNKADAAASQAVTATGLNTGVDVAAAGTYQRLKVRIEANGTMKTYIDGVQVGEIFGAAATTVAVNPVLYLESASAAVKTMLVKEFWAASYA